MIKKILALLLVLSVAACGSTPKQLTVTSGNGSTVVVHLETLFTFPFNGMTAIGAVAVAKTPDGRDVAARYNLDLAECKGDKLRWLAITGVADHVVYSVQSAEGSVARQVHDAICKAYPNAKIAPLEPPKQAEDKKGI